jgi:small subunit ribosomal protein S2
MSKTTNLEGGNALIEEMFSAGAHYGYSKTRRHPSVASFIYGTKNRTDIINLEKTSTMLSEAQEFVKGLGARGKTLLFVGTKPEAQETIISAAKSLEMPYVAERWIGGTLSNFSEIKKRINELENYRKESADGTLGKYTKKERSVLGKKMDRLSKYYSGLIGLKKIPEAVFVVDPRAEDIAATEAQKSGVTVIGLANSDSNISHIDYPILGNDAATPSIKFFVEAIVSAYKEGQASAPAKKEEK